MKEYIERMALIEKLQAHKDLFVKAWGTFRKMPEKDKARVDEITTCISDVMNAPAADVVEVTRCKDCRRRYDADECPMCYLIQGEHQDYTADDGFCDRGERRDNT